MSEIKTKKFRIPFFTSLFEKLIENKLSLAVYVVLTVMVLGSIAENAYKGAWNYVTAATLAFLMMLIPAALKVLLRIKLTAVLESLAYIFIFSSEILGEIRSFYGRFPFWDGWLHVISGVMFAALGFCLVDIFNKHKDSRFRMSPLFLALIAFCFSMTVGVVWEFIEFTGDTLVKTDMQKDYIIHNVHTVYYINYGGESNVSHFTEIASSVMYDAAGNEIVSFPGVLDIGLIDTIKDMALNTLGALLFCIFGYVSIRRGGKGRIINQFMPRYTGDEDETTDTADVPAETTVAPDPEG